MQRMSGSPQIRCEKCGKLLGKGAVRDFSTKCPRCGTINHITGGAERGASVKQ
jgi:phage FluMu protein Com